MRRQLLLLALLAPTAARAAPGAGVSVPTAPSAWSTASASDAPADPWWSALGEPAIVAIVTEALDANRDLLGAVERMRAADALRFQAITPLLPNLSWDSSISAQPASLRFAQFTGGESEGDEGLYYFATTTFNASLELDVAGRNALGVQAATRDLAASGADADAIAQGIASRAGGAWLDAGLHQARLETLERLVGANRDILRVVELRFARGEAGGVDVLQQRAQVAGLDAQLPLARAARAVAEQQLALLLGRTPDDVPDGLPTTLPELGPTPRPGSPADLLDARPDLRAASDRLTSAWQRRLAAERAFLPTLRLTANAGWSFTNNAGSSGLSGGGGADYAAAFAQLESFLQGLDPTFPGFDLGGGGQPPDTTPAASWFAWGFGASLSFPIFNGGRSIAALRSARASERIAAQQVASARLGAWSQVETTLAADREQGLRLAAIRDQAEAARGAFDAARARYVEGIGDYLTVLSTLVSLQNAELSALQAHRDALATRIQLHEALGGAWTRNLSGGTP